VLKSEFCVSKWIHLLDLADHVFADSLCLSYGLSPDLARDIETCVEPAAQEVSRPRLSPRDNIWVYIKHILDPSFCPQSLILIVRIKIIPPLGLIFEPPVKPSHNGSCPNFSLVIGHDVMVLVEDLDIFDFSSQNLQGREKLRALTWRNICILRAMKEE
jgi:hypothetical protein